MASQNMFALLGDDNQEGGSQAQKKQGSKRETIAKKNATAPTGGAGASSQNRNGAGKAPKRQFDRQSGMGDKKGNGKNGSGKGNWGSDQAEAERGTQEAKAEGAVEGGEKRERQERAPRPEPEPEEPEGQSYDEYLAGLKVSEEDSNVKVREAVNDDKQFKTEGDLMDDTSLDNGQSWDLFVGGGGKAEKFRKKKKNKSKKISLDEFCGDTPKQQAPRERREDNRGGDNRGRGRDDRGGGRGGGRGGAGGRGRGGGGRGRGGGDRRGGGRGGGGQRGGGGFRGGPNVNDQGAFPSL